MPVIPSVSHEAVRSRGPALPVGQLHAEEEEATESMKVYLKPLTHYDILQARATNKLPLFFARGLCYKLQGKHTKKVQLSVSISGAIGDHIHSQTIFPVCVLLVRQVPTPNGETLRASSYQFKKAVKLTADRTQAKFTLPEIKKLSAVVKDRSFSILLVSCADHITPFEIDRTKDKKLAQLYAGDCVMGKVPIEDFLHLTCETPNMSLGKRLQSKSTVSMQSCFMKTTFSDVVTFLIQYKSISASKLQQVHVVVTAEEAGGKAIDNNNISTNLLPPGLGIKPGDVTFKYKCYNDVVGMTEVMLDYSCPFCYLACASYKGLKCHPQASHDLFDYEFEGDDIYKVVNVSYNKTDAFSLQKFGILAREEKEFFFRHKALTRTKIEEDQTQLTDDLGHFTLGPNVAGVHSKPSDLAKYWRLYMGKLWKGHTDVTTFFLDNNGFRPFGRLIHSCLHLARIELETSHLLV